MNKILLVIQREYLTRVKKPSFWVLTIVVPILLAGVYAIPIILASRPIEHAHVLLVDDTGLFQGQFRSGRDITYHEAGSIEYARRELQQHDSLDAIVYIPARETTLPRDAYLYYRSDAPSLTVQTDAQNQLQEILRNSILLDVHGLTPEDYALLTSTHIKLRPQDIETGRDGFLQVKIVVGVLLAFLVFMAVFMFGSQVMRGVMEEKTSRIVEVIVCSVKPFQLMMGKVVGIGLVGLTQFALWVLLSGIAVVGVQASNADLFQQATAHQTEIASKGTEATTQYEAEQARAAEYEAGQGIDNSVKELIEGLTGINFAMLIVLFVFYFVFGYLLYASLFAAAGSLVDNETDSQQFTLPMTVPLILTLLLMPAMVGQPSGSLSVWLSIIPFTSPVAMLMRIPFGVPVWQVAVSMLLLLITFPLCIWAAAKVYRSAILRYGQKASWRDVWRFLRIGS
ncbi:MAG: ABC transporter permease [Bacteroidales bacterium]|jgi:ABC-2 type transport system permease protein|nr:ABC transporter permease [Bacteroidales bacterium]